MSTEPDQEYFTDGTVEDITTGLSPIRSLFVISAIQPSPARGARSMSDTPEWITASRQRLRSSKSNPRQSKIAH